MIEMNEGIIWVWGIDPTPRGRLILLEYVSQQRRQADHDIAKSYFHSNKKSFECVCVYGYVHDEK